MSCFSVVFAQFEPPVEVRVFSPIRRHLTYANIAATLALVFSMGSWALDR
jgi:hypothetical protein